MCNDTDDDNDNFYLYHITSSYRTQNLTKNRKSRRYSDGFTLYKDRVKMLHIRVGMERELTSREDHRQLP